MTMNRREFAAMMAGALGGLSIPLLIRSNRARDDAESVPAAASRRSQYFDWRRVRPRIDVALMGGGNAVLYRGTREALVSDGKNFGLGRTLAREAREFGTPVTWLVSTHHHGDHTGGNEAFGDRVRLAHANAAPRILATAEEHLSRAETSLTALRSRLAETDAPAEMTDDLESLIVRLDALSPRDFGPTETFDDLYEIDLDGHPVTVRWISRAHTDGDAFVHFPEENVIHCGDLLFRGRHPYIDITSDATPRGWIRCLDTMLALCDDETVVIPGHGEPTDRAGLEAQRDYFRQLEAIVEAGLREGRSREEIELRTTPALRSLSGAEQQLRRNLGIVYDEMAG